jgi:hypothetical protein
LRRFPSPQEEAERAAWMPDPAQPERVCQRCRRMFTPAGPFNRYFCSPVCQDRANADLGYAYAVEQGVGSPHRRIVVVGGGA